MLFGFYEGKGGGNNLNYQREYIGENGFFLFVIGKLLLKVNGIQNCSPVVWCQLF